MNIMFVTDYVCPYCIVAKEALKKALEELNLSADIMIQPYELTPFPKPQPDTYSDPVRREHYKVLTEPCRQLGLNLHIPPHIVPRPRTHLAFLGFYYADKMGKGEKYSDEAYLAYFRDERDIGDMTVLKDIAIKAGLDAEEFEKSVTSGEFESLLQQANQYDREELKVKGVPTIYIDGEQVSAGGYTVEDFKKVLLNHSNSETVLACGPDGCN